MAKKKASKKKPARRKKPAKDEPMSKGFGHLTIEKGWVVRTADWTLPDTGDDRTDSRKCWEDCDWDE